MDRLTTNKPVKDMNMYELAHNSSYIDKYGNTRYRDYETDVDARALTRELLKKYAEHDDAFTDDDDFDNAMMDLLQYGTGTIEGVIALFYRNLWAMAELRETLKQYEVSEEQDLYINKADFKNKVELLGTNYAFNAEMGYGDAINDILKLLDKNLGEDKAMDEQKLKILKLLTVSAIAYAEWHDIITKKMRDNKEIGKLYMELPTVQGLSNHMVLERLKDSGIDVNNITSIEDVLKAIN